MKIAWSVRIKILYRGDNVYFSRDIFGEFYANVDPECDRFEYGIPSKTSLKRKRRAYEEEEREGIEDGKYNGSNYAGTGENILQL